jgi:insertion element IS1 protein InsB
MLSFKKNDPAQVNPFVVDKIESGQLSELEVEICYATEWDEFWSYVGSKENQRWTWYLIERSSGVVLAWENGRRQDAVLKRLLNKVAHLPVKICHTDDWGAYTRLFPQEYLHIIGKDNTWKIERKNLNFRIHLKRLHRKTICFSKKVPIHDNVIGMYIESYYYKHGNFAEATAA